MNAISIEAPAQSSAMTLDGTSLLNFVAMAVKDSSIDVTKLEVLLRMQREILADDAKLQFNRAMSAVQAEMAPIVRDAPNEQTKSKFARLETIDAAMRPIYTRHGFSLSFNSEPIEGANVRIACEVAHMAGHSKTYHLEAALDMAGPQGKANKTPLHGLGSSVSYLRRYLTCMIFHVVLMNEDNDGNPLRPDTSLISHAQKMDLKGLLRETHTLESRFLEVMCPGLNGLEEATAVDFVRLKNSLISKRTILAKRAAQAQNGEARA